MLGFATFMFWYVGMVVSLVRDADAADAGVSVPAMCVRALLWPLRVVGRATDVLQLPPGESP